MKRYRVVVLALLAILLATSCHRDRMKDGSRIYDFGVVRYSASPFVGMLKNHPLFLEKSLDIPPYKWCVPQKQYGKEKDFQVGFNTGAYLDSAESKVLFCGNDGALYADEVVRVYINGVDQKAVAPLSALNTNQMLTVGMWINPELKDTTLTGRVAFVTKDLDKINEHLITSSPSVLDSWVIKQKKPCFFWLYFLWVLTALLLLILLLILICILLILLREGIDGLENFFSWLFTTIGDFFTKIGSIFTRRSKRNKKNQKKGKQKKSKVGGSESIGLKPRIMFLSDYVYTDGRDGDKAIIMKESLNGYLNYCDRVGEYERYYRMYQNIEWMFKGGKMCNAEKKILWSNEAVDHFAYISIPMRGEKKPEQDAYVASKCEFYQHVEEFSPDYIVVLGRGLYSRLEMVNAFDNITCKILNTDSASFPFFNRSHWHDYLKANVKEPLNHYYE